MFKQKVILVSAAILVVLTNAAGVIFAVKEAQSRPKLAVVDLNYLMGSAPNRYEIGDASDLVQEAGGTFASSLQQAITFLSREEQIVLIKSGAALSDNLPDLTSTVQILIDRRMADQGYRLKDSDPSGAPLDSGDDSDVLKTAQ